MNSQYQFIEAIFKNGPYPDKSVDGVLGTRNWGGRMVGAAESTEQWPHADLIELSHKNYYLHNKRLPS